MKGLQCLEDKKQAIFSYSKTNEWIKETLFPNPHGWLNKKIQSQFPMLNYNSIITHVS